MVAQMSQLQPLEQGAILQARIPRNGAKFRSFTCTHRLSNQTLQNWRKSGINGLCKIDSGFHKRCRIANRIAR